MSCFFCMHWIGGLLGICGRLGSRFTLMAKGGYLCVYDEVDQSSFFCFCFVVYLFEHTRYISAFLNAGRIGNRTY